MRRRLAVVTAVLLLGASGCGGSGSSAEPEPEPLEPTLGSTAAAPSVPEGVPTTPPPGAPAKQRNTTESALAFAQYFVRLYYHAYATRDVEVLMDLVPDEVERDRKQCDACFDTRKTLAEHEREKRYLVSPEPRISGYIQKGRRGVQRIILVTYQRPAGKYVHEDGGTKPIRGSDEVNVEVLVAWDRGHWVVLNYAFVKSEG